MGLYVNTTFDQPWSVSKVLETLLRVLRSYLSTNIWLWTQISIYFGIAWNTHSLVSFIFEQEHKIEHICQILRHIYCIPNLSNFSVPNEWLSRFNRKNVLMKKLTVSELGWKRAQNVCILIRRLLFLREPVKDAFSVSRATGVSHAFTSSNCLDYLRLLLQHLVNLINSVFDT